MVSQKIHPDRPLPSGFFRKVLSQILRLIPFPRHLLRSSPRGFFCCGSNSLLVSIAPFFGAQRCCWRRWVTQDASNCKVTGWGHSMTPTQTKCTIIGEIPQNHHAFALFDLWEMGRLMTPVTFQDMDGWNLERYLKPKHKSIGWYVKACQGLCSYVHNRRFLHPHLLWLKIEVSTNK